MGEVEDLLIPLVIEVIGIDSKKFCKCGLRIPCGVDGHPSTPGNPQAPNFPSWKSANYILILQKLLRIGSISNKILLWDSLQKFHDQ